MCLDLALRHRRGDPFVVVDLQETGWAERYTAADHSLAPRGEELIQAQMPIRPGESADAAASRLERLLDASFVDWRERETWRRRQVMNGRTGSARPARQVLARPAGDRPRRRRLPRRRHGRGAGVSVRDRLGERGPGRRPRGRGGGLTGDEPIAGRCAGDAALVAGRPALAFGMYGETCGTEGFRRRARGDRRAASQGRRRRTAARRGARGAARHRAQGPHAR